MDKLKYWEKIFDVELDFDHIRPWTVKDPGLDYKEFHGYIDALRYNAEFLCKYEGKWKGEQKMGTKLGSLVNGGLYYRDDDGNFVKLMTVTKIEENINTCYDEMAEITVDGYAPRKSEKIEVNNTSRRMLGSISEKYSLDDHVYFMIFDGTTFSVKIDRTSDYNKPYCVTIYDAGLIVWAKAYTTWHELTCTFMYEVGLALDAWFSSDSIKHAIPQYLQEAARAVKYHYINTDSTEQRAIIQAKQLESEKRRDFFNELLSWQFKNGEKGYLSKDTNIENVIFNNPATIVFWKDGTKTVVHTQNGERYDKEKGLAMAISKKAFGNKRDYYNTFKRWFRKGEDRSIKRLIDKLGNNGEEE